MEDETREKKDVGREEGGVIKGEGKKKERNSRNQIVESFLLKHEMHVTRSPTVTA
jgi:hypothetical protein